MRIVIPNKFKCLNRSCSVRYMSKAELKDSAWDSLDGYYSPERAEIVLRRHMEPEYEFHTFLHEFTHMVLETAGRTDLSIDEEFVDQISGLFAQFLSTKRGNINTT